MDPILDHVARAQNRLVYRLRKPKILALVASYAAEVQELEDALTALRAMRTLSTATGIYLDILGAITGQPRQGRSDASYRLWIAARALANRSSGTTEQVIAIVKKLVGDARVVPREEPPAGFSIAVDDPIDAAEGAEIAKIVRIAKAVGVRAAFEWFADDAFTFADDATETFDDTVHGFGSGELASASGGGSTDYAPATVTPLTTRLGGSLIGSFEVPATDDATIDVIADRVQSITDATGGGPPLAAVAPGNRPHYRTGASGPNGEPYLEVDTGLYLEVPFAVVGANRVCLYVVMMAPADPGAVRDVVTMSGSGTSRLRIDGSADRYVHVQAFNSAGEVTLSLTSPPLVLGRWQLHALRPIASGARSEVDGLATSPNFATADFGAEIATVRVGSSGNAAGAVKAVYLVVDPTEEQNAEVFDYVVEKGWLS